MDSEFRANGPPTKKASRANELNHKSGKSVQGMHYAGSNVEVGGRKYKLVKRHRKLTSIRISRSP